MECNDASLSAHSALGEDNIPPSKRQTEALDKKIVSVVLTVLSKFLKTILFGLY